MSRRLSDLEHYAKVRDGWLIDTNVLSATMRSEPLHPGIDHFFKAVPDDRLRLSVLSIGEIKKGIELLPFDAAMLDDLERYANSKSYRLQRKLDELQSLWADRILPVSLEVANRWGELAARCQSDGLAVSAIDGLIAATAYVYNLVVVSHDALFARLRRYIITYDPYEFVG